MITYYTHKDWRSYTDGGTRIHRADCRHCNYGEGNQGLPNKKSAWFGPFEKLSNALSVARGLSMKDTALCKHCDPGRERSDPEAAESRRVRGYSESHANVC